MTATVPDVLVVTDDTTPGELAEAITAVRPYADLDDLVRRVRIPLPVLEALATAGAFGCFGLGRREAIWAVGALAQLTVKQAALALGDQVTSSYVDQLLQSMTSIHNSLSSSASSAQTIATSSDQLASSSTQLADSSGQVASIWSRCWLRLARRSSKSWRPSSVAWKLQ